MSKCSILVDSLEGVLVSEDYLRGYLEAFGVVSDSISQTESGRSTVTCDRCYDILDRLTTMNADHQKPSHKGRKLRFQLVSERDPLSVRDCMGQQPSNELVVSGFSVDNVSQSDLTGLFGLYGTIVFFELRDDTATVEVLIAISMLPWFQRLQ